MKQLPPAHDTFDTGHDTLRVPEEDLSDLASTLAATMAEVRRHTSVLDQLRSAQVSEPGQDGTHHRSVFILSMSGQPYAAELAELGNWVHRVLLPVYGREISSHRPWCERWHEHREAVARLHALWLAWKELTSAEAGLTGPSIWQRDHLDNALLQLRSPDGPFAACTTDADRPNHRLLPPPGLQNAAETR